MKKFIVSLMVLLGISVAANAQSKSCRVIGDDNASVVVTVVRVNDSSVELAINSDSSKYVNITFSLIVEPYGGGNAENSGPITVTVAPRQSTSKTVSFRTKRISRVYKLEVSGARCEKD